VIFVAVLKKMSPGRLIVLGFAMVIIIGTLLLALPFSFNRGVKISLIDALFTSTSAVCITGLATVDIRDSFNVFGRIVVALLIQVGGLGFASVSVGFFLLAGKKVSFKDRLVVKEALNLGSIKGIVKLVKSILLITVCFESVGAILSFIVFYGDYPLFTALGISVFHAVSSFNNAGFDILGGFTGLVPYADNVLLNLTTCGLIIFGGLGFLVIKEIIIRHSFKKFSLHTKIVIIMTLTLLITGTLLIKLTEDVSWMGAFFFSTSARTAGFATYSLGTFTNAGLFVIIILMFIGASPGSTGGGIKTTTVFTLFKSVYSAATNKHCSAFKRKIPHDIVTKAFFIAFLAVSLICVDTFLISIIEPEFTFMQILFEVVSAFGTVGLSTGITPELSPWSKIILILTMFIGRLGPLTIATVWSTRRMSNVTYSEETIIIG